jgi:hypothetical protein
MERRCRNAMLTDGDVTVYLLGGLCRHWPALVPLHVGTYQYTKLC